MPALSSPCQDLVSAPRGSAVRRRVCRAEVPQVYTLRKLGACERDPMADPAAARGGRTAGSPRRQAVTATAPRGLSRFARTRGVPAGREFLLDYDVIEAFCVAGLTGRASSTRGTYRSALYRLPAGADGPPGRRPAAVPAAGAPGAVPPAGEP